MSAVVVVIALSARVMFFGFYHLRHDCLTSIVKTIPVSISANCCSVFQKNQQATISLFPSFCRCEET